MEVSRYELLLTTHHIATDGWSLDVFVAELGVQYGALLGGREAALPPLPLEYTDFAIWQRAWLKSEVLEEESRYWMRQLDRSSGRASGCRWTGLAETHQNPAVAPYCARECRRPRNAGA